MDSNIRPRRTGYTTSRVQRSGQNSPQRSRPGYNLSHNKNSGTRRDDKTNKKTYGKKPVPQAEVEDTKKFQSASDGSIRIITLGGIGEIGKNMYAVEYNNEIILLECGTAFGEGATPGIDTLMPNIQYLKDRKKQVRAIIVGDAALTHSGAVPHIVKTLDSAKLYMRDLTKNIVVNREKAINGKTNLEIEAIEKETSVEVSKNIKLHFFGISSDTPSTLAVIIETPSGNVAYTGNVRVNNKKNVIPADEEKRFEILKEKDILITISDSVNAERPGFAIYDEGIATEIAQMISEAKGRSIVPLFPSQIKSNSLIIEKSVKLGKRVYIQGKELYENLILASESGVLDLPKEILIPIQELAEIDDPKKALILLTGEENEEYESLDAIVRKTHRFISLIEKDTIIFPSPMIPARAGETQDLKDDLSRAGAIIRSYDTSDVKASGHAGKAELRWLHQLASTKYFLPVQGYHYMLTAHTHILREIGMSMDSAILADNGNVIDISSDGKRIEKLKKTLPTTSVVIIGNTTFKLQEVVLQDRRILSENGIFIIIVFFDQKTLLLRKSPDIISRGFIYLRESQDLIGKTRLYIKKVAEDTTRESSRMEIDVVKRAIQKEVSKFLERETNKKPIVVPVLFT